MRRLSRLAIVLVGVFVGTQIAAAQQGTDLLGVPGPIIFAGEDYHLAWSSRPTEQYTKQEYLPEGQKPETYRAMVLVEFLTGETTPAQAANAQVAALNERRGSDPLVNMELIQNPNTGEIILDFIVSSRDSNGEYIVEWNAYRYVSASNAKGSSGSLLFGISHRAYGNDAAKAFLTSLRDFKTGQISALSSMPMPEL